MWARPYLTGILRTPVRLSARWTPVRWVALQCNQDKHKFVNFLPFSSELSYTLALAEELILRLKTLKLKKKMLHIASM